MHINTKGTTADVVCESCAAVVDRANGQASQEAPAGRPLIRGSRLLILPLDLDGDTHYLTNTNELDRLSFNDSLRLRL